MRRTLPAEIMLAVGDRSFSDDRAGDLVYITGCVLEHDANGADAALRSALVILAAHCVQWTNHLDSNGQEAA